MSTLSILIKHPLGIRHMNVRESSSKTDQVFALVELNIPEKEINAK